MKKIALVTGGTRGIGAAISKELHQKGYTVIATYAANHEAAKKFTVETGIQTLTFDVSNEKECRDAITHISGHYGKINVLVHNAGITRDALLHKMTTEQWHEAVQTNLNSCFYISQPVAAAMKDHGYGRIVYISSINAIRGQRGQTNYTAAKAGVIGFAKSLALEVARYGVTVNVVAPGYIDTDMVRAIPEKLRESFTGQIPVGRFGTADEIAHCVSFVVDTRAAFITGAVIHANGGMYID
jgi:acetoacetyl-CoA reductase